MYKQGLARNRTHKHRKQRAVLSEAEIHEAMLRPERLAEYFSTGHLGCGAQVIELAVREFGYDRAEGFVREAGGLIRVHRPSRGVHQQTIDGIAAELSESPKNWLVIPNQIYNGMGSGENDIFVAQCKKEMLYHYYEVKACSDRGAHAKKQISRWAEYMVSHGIPFSRLRGIYVWYDRATDTTRHTPQKMS